MSEPTLELLQAMIQKVLDTRRDDVLFQKETTQRLAHIESLLVVQRRESSLDAEGVALLSARFDRLAEEVDRIKRRLDIGGAD